MEIIGDQNHKWLESGTGHLNAEPESELAGLGGGGRAEAEWRAGPSRTLRPSLGEAPAPGGESAAKFTQADSAPARNGGRGQCAGPGEEPAGVGGKEASVRTGGDRSGPGVSTEKGVSPPVPPPAPPALPTEREGAEGPCGWEAVGDGVGERKTRPRWDKGKLRFIERLPCARHCARRFTYIIALHPHNNPAR